MKGFVDTSVLVATFYGDHEHDAASIALFVRLDKRRWLFERPTRRYDSRMIIAHLPGAELIETGLADLSAGTVSVESLLVSIAAPGLRDVGLVVDHPIADAELQLYALLSARDGAAAHSRYNALLRRVTSFRRAAQCAR